MLEMTHCINYGGKIISFQVSFSLRKSLAISVNPDLSIFIKAPEGTHLRVIEDRVKKRARWIMRQIQYFGQFNPKTPMRRYVGGESHLYLGKEYRLKISQAENSLVRLKNGFFFIETSSKAPKYIETLLDSWYQEKANIYLTTKFNDCWEKFHHKEYLKPTLKILKLKKRWGSLSNTGILSLNFDLIKTPKECIDYVIIHELCHLVHNNHSPEFFRLLELALPDWLKRKYKLEMALI